MPSVSILFSISRRGVMFSILLLRSWQNPLHKQILHRQNTKKIVVCINKQVLDSMIHFKIMWGPKTVQSITSDWVFTYSWPESSFVFYLCYERCLCINAYLFLGIIKPKLKSSVSNLFVNKGYWKINWDKGSCWASVHVKGWNYEYKLVTRTEDWIIVVLFFISWECMSALHVSPLN